MTLDRKIVAKSREKDLFKDLCDMRSLLYLR